MASRKQKKSKGEPATTSASTAASDQSSEKTATTAARTAKRAAKKTARKRGARRIAARGRRPGRPKGSKNRERTSAKPAAKRATKKSARPRRYTPAERAKILAAAKREGLSGPAAAKKFGISQLTFYTWRRKSGASATKRTAGRPRGASNRHDGFLPGDIGERVRQEVRARVSEMLPEIIQSEIDSALGTSGGRRRGT